MMRLLRPAQAKACDTILRIQTTILQALADGGTGFSLWMVC